LEIIGEKLWLVFLWVETKLSAIVSIGLAIAVIYFSNFFKIIFEHPGIDLSYLYLSIISYTASLCIIFYLSFYLPYFKKIHEDQWDSYCPNMIPITTICGILGVVFLISAIWDVYRWYSIPMVLIINWGMVMTAHFAPGNVIGDFIFFSLLAGALISGYYIEHNGYLH
jgi:hypothetical protein